jgi:glycosyltransferase involved in cell wall biosynthesis
MSAENNMQIALIGTRGVPANYGGFETCVEELGKRLVERGHEVTVYCRDSYYKQKTPTYLGMKLKYLPNLKRKSLDTLSHTFLSVLDAIHQPFDVLMVFNAANSPTLFLPRILGKKIAINTDGLEWKRGKWGPVARNYYKLSEWLSTKLAHRIVADSTGIQDYYRERYGVDSTYIAYGAYISQSRKPELLDTLGLTPGGYFLQITRFEPENNPLLTIDAYKRLTTNKKLVLVGGVPYESEYSRQIKVHACENILLPGSIYDKELLNELWCNCYAYVHGNEVGGTNPALLQTMASGCFTIAIDVSFSRDVLQDGGIFFKKTEEDLSSKIRWALEHPDELDEYRRRAQVRIQEKYTWEKVTDGYEALFRELVAGKFS